MLPPLKFLKARGPHYIFKAIEECSSMNSSLISSLEMNFHKNFFKFKIPNSIWIRLDRFNETHWADRQGNKIILYNVTQPMFNGFRISNTAGNFNPGNFLKISLSWMIRPDQIIVPVRFSTDRTVVREFGRIIIRSGPWSGDNLGYLIFW